MCACLCAHVIDCGNIIDIYNAANGCEYLPQILWKMLGFSFSLSSFYVFLF